MSLQHSPGIVTNGLTFYYDMYNTEKSWKGEPVTNQFICPNPYDSNNNVSFNVQGTGTFQRVYTGTYGGYTIKPTDVVYRYNLGGSGCHYHGNSAAIASSQYVCYSVDYYISPDASDYPTNSSLIVLENYGGSALGGGTGTGGNGVMGKWQTIRGYAGPTGGSGTQAMFLYPGGCGSSYMASRGFILMKNPMFEFRGDVRYNPFVNGTRSNTQAIIDLTGQNTITATSLTYASDGIFSWASGVDARIQAPSSSIFSFGTGDFTLECWIKPDNFNNYVHMIALPDQNTFALKANTGDGAIYFYSPSFTTYPTSGWTLVAGTWNHVVMTRAGNTSYSYLNGSLKGSKAGFTNNFTAQTLNIGNGFSNEYTAKSIAAVRIYNRALTAQQVQQNFAAQRGRYGI